MVNMQGIPTNVTLLDVVAADNKFASISVLRLGSLADPAEVRSQAAAARSQLAASFAHAMPGTAQAPQGTDPGPHCILHR
jgi:hypothetical protein